jgi:hypothetical protein
MRYLIYHQAAEEILEGRRSWESVKAFYVRNVKIYSVIRNRDNTTGGGDGDMLPGNGDENMETIPTDANGESISEEDIEEFRKWKWDMFDEVYVPALSSYSCIQWRTDASADLGSPHLLTSSRCSIWIPPKPQLTSEVSLMVMRTTMMRAGRSVNGLVG